MVMAEYAAEKGHEGILCASRYRPGAEVGVQAADRDDDFRETMASMIS